VGVGGGPPPPRPRLAEKYRLSRCELEPSRRRRGGAIVTQICPGLLLEEAQDVHGETPSQCAIHLK